MYMKICKFVPEFNFAAFIFNLAVCTKLGVVFKFSVSCVLVRCGLFVENSIRFGNFEKIQILHGG